MKKTTMICFALTMIIVGCKKVTVDFTYSPAEPRAGETIKFSNNSSAGESWAWSFGDNSTSMSKHPSKIYKKAGTYMVTLMVDSAKNQTHSKLITVCDTTPTFVCSSDSVLHYHDVTLTANIYNPFKYQLSYQWTLPDDCVLQSGKLTDASIVVYFTATGEIPVQLSITQNDTTFNINNKSIVVYPVKAPSIVMRNTDKIVMRQRIINDRIEKVTDATDTDKRIIEQATDTLVEFNGITFTASQLSTTIPNFAQLSISRIQIDKMAQKWYLATANGLLVANFDGSNQVMIDAQATGALYVDVERNRIYWASNKGVYGMPLVKSKNNRFTTTPLQYNDLTNVDRIVVNEKLQ